MTHLLTGMAIMATVALQLRGLRDEARLRRAGVMLALFTGILALVLLLDVGRWSEWGSPLLPTLPLLLARHIEQLVGTTRSWRRDSLLAASGLLTLPYLLMPPAMRAEMDLGIVPELDPRLLLLILAAFGVFWTALVAATAFAGIRVFRAIRHHRALLAQIVALPPTRRLSGVTLLVASLAIVFGLQLLDLLSLGTVLTGPAADLFVLALILGAAIHGLTLRPTWPDWAYEVVAAVQETDPAAPRYARSGLGHEGMAHLLARLDAAMQRDELWRSADLTLADLAAAARAKPFYVSQALNQGRQESFFDYVNRLRVREAQCLLRNSDQPVLDIAYAVGFNAKSTFNAAFRKVAGMTPSQWRTSAPAGTDASEQPD